ncbi:MAG: type II toxin-antitoxin system Phd/YefM family antitoxin [Actinobacteria bacterium]|nr:type II toxin-antitoxin system Phd/YefM family antitoxin [Actinomycetota bacterium]
MAIGIRDLKNRAPEIVRAVEESGSAVVVTRHGRPAALILPIGSPEAEDYVLAHAPEIVASLREADRDHRAGRTTTLGSYRRRRGH